MEILKGHTSQATAHIQENYPYSFGQRCKKRYWVEHRPGFGYRLVTQTSKPPKNIEWNQPRMSRYAESLELYLDDDRHVRVVGMRVRVPDRRVRT